MVTRPYEVTRLGAAEEPRPLPSAADDEDPRLARMRAEAVLLLAKTPLSPRKLAQLDASALCSGHGEPILIDAGERLRALLRDERLANVVPQRS